MPMGPCELLDEIGLDIAAHVLKSLSHGSVVPPSVLATFAQAMEKKWLGKKSGRGFYVYPEKKGEKSPQREACSDVDSDDAQ